jgi:sarcosine oxidase subunit beta
VTAATADVIIIGAGVIGCSTAFHLAALGLKPLVLERKGISQAATSYAAGLLTRARSNPCLMPLVQQTYLDVQRLAEITGDSLGLRTTGSLYVGSSKAAKQAHQELMALALIQGETVRQLSPSEAMRRLPWLRLEGEEEVFEMPEDAFIDGYTLATSYARAARQKGATIRENLGVVAILRNRERVTGVRTINGCIETPIVIDAAGAWSNLLAQGVGQAIPMAPVRSHYWITKPDQRFPRDMPYLILPDAKAYARPEVGGLLFGFREAQSVHADPRTLPETMQGHVVAGDADGWASLEEGLPVMERFFPAFEDLVIAHYVSGYSTYTPNGMLAVGPLPGLKGFFSGSGCSGGGVAMGGGIGKALAQMITGAQLDFDMKPHDPGRFGAIDPFSYEWRQRCADARSRKTSG